MWRPLAFTPTICWAFTHPTKRAVARGTALCDTDTLLATRLSGMVVNAEGRRATIYRRHCYRTAPMDGNPYRARSNNARVYGQIRGLSGLEIPKRWIKKQGLPPFQPCIALYFDEKNKNVMGAEVRVAERRKRQRWVRDVPVQKRDEQ